MREIVHVYKSIQTTLLVESLFYFILYGLWYQFIRNLGVT